MTLKEHWLEFSDWSVQEQLTVVSPRRNCVSSLIAVQLGRMSLSILSRHIALKLTVAVVPPSFCALAVLSFGQIADGLVTSWNKKQQNH